MLLEWVRLYFFTGFTWNPAGLAFGGSSYAIQLASLFGIYGLSFWVIWTNLGALALLTKAFWKTGRNLGDARPLSLWIRWVHENWVKSSFTSSKQLTAAMIDTDLLVEEKHRDRKNPSSFHSSFNAMGTRVVLFGKRSACGSHCPSRRGVSLWGQPAFLFCRAIQRKMGFAFRQCGQSRFAPIGTSLRGSL